MESLRKDLESLKREVSASLSSTIKAAREHKLSPVGKPSPPTSKSTSRLKSKGTR